MERKYGIGAVSHGANNWQPRQATPWQRERASGVLLPMETPSLFQRMREWVRR